MSRRGFGTHRDRSPDGVDSRSNTRLRTEVQQRRPPALPQLHVQSPEQEPQGVQRLMSGNMTEEALYAKMCPSDGEVLPPGWEKIFYHGTVVYLDHISREAHEVRPWEVWQRRSESANDHSSVMNLRTLTSFWKKGKGKENTNRYSGSSDTSQTCQLNQQQQQQQQQRQQQQYLGQRPTAPFEGTQAALRYIQHLLDSRRPIFDSLSSRINDKRTSTETRLGRTQLLSKEDFSALRQEREEMIAALDLCLVVIPSDMVITTNRDGKRNSKEEDSQALENPQGETMTMKMMNREDSETTAATTTTTTTGEEGGGGISSDELVVKMEIDTPLPQTENVATETNINQEQWRRLLWKLVNVLLEIDIDAYADIVMRSRQPTQSSTPFGLSPLSPTRTSSSYPITSPSGLTCEGGENVHFSVSNPTSSATIANVTPTPSNTNTTTVTATTVTVGTTGGKKGTGVVTTTGIDTVLNGEIKSHELRVSEEQLVLVNTITTWIILRTVLRHQIEEYSVSNFEEVSREKNEVSSTTVANNVTSTSFVPWEEVVLDMMDIFCVQHRGIVESVISLWIKRENHGRELLQDILQKPRSSSNDIVDGNNGKQTVTTTNSVVNGVNEKKVDNQVTTSTNSVTVENSSESFIMDDVVEEIEIMFEQGVIMTWVAYLEQQPSGFFLDQTRNQDEILPSVSFLHCHMMATYAVCSPHWEEERVQHAFQMLKKVWEYNYDNSSSSDVNRTLTPDIIVAAAGERSISSNVDGFSGLDTGDGLMEPTSSDIPKNSHMTQTASELQTTASDLESHSFRSLSVNSIQVESTVPTTVTVRDVMRVSFEDDIMPFMFQAAWATALHVRVEQCLNNSNREKTGACFLEEAEHFANKERDVSFLSKSFSCRQGSLESLIKVNITNGNYSAALKVANTHFNNAKKKWSGGKTSYWSCVSYLNSMGLLAQAQDACRMDASLLETTQFALQQVSLCEQVINDLSPTTGIYLVRYADARHVIFQAKLFHLRMSWISYHRMNDTVRSAKYFELYMEHVKNIRRSKRAIEAYTALRERGEELEEEKQYRDAVIIFKQATENAKNIPITPKPLIVSTSKSTTTVQSTVTTIGGTVNSNLSETDGLSENSSNSENGLQLIRQTAESERNLALAYVLEAEHEVNVKERRQQLSNAVNSAYAAHNALLRCMEQVKVPSSGMLIDLAASLVVTCKALLRLGQPKKAALLLEPLIADKANSAYVRPPFWLDLLNSPAYSATTTSTTTTTTNSNSNSNNTSINASEMIKRLATLRVKIAACDVHTQCLSKYDGERACRETRNACEFLEKVRTWLKSFIVGEKSNSKTLEGEKEHISLPFVGKIGLYKSLIRANETIPILTITRGDSLAMLGKWEDALQEYSNALAMYSGGDPDSSILDSVQSETDRERVLNDYKMGESRVLSKLAEVYTALEKPKTAIHYYRQVLEYATEFGDALLQYNTRIRLARLYTATGDTEKAADHWAKVSELAKEYEDQEISRETMRNIVAAQRANGMYMDVINTAKELNTLASSAEGVDAAADRRFALEALADAHLQLGQYKECIKVLDEQEKVQYKCGKWNGTLLHMRARALLGDEAVTEAIKVLTSWAHEARLLGNWVEVGHANAVLALAYATARQTLKAKRHHKIALATFACVAEMDRESCQAVIESARWLVHYFYLNDEQVKLEEGLKERAGRVSFSKNGIPTTTTTTSAENAAGTGGNSGSSSSISSNMSSNSGGGVGVGGSKSNDGISSGNSGNDSDYSEVRNDSGDLNVLMMKEEMRVKKRRGSKGSGSKEMAREGESNNGGSDEEVEALSNCSMFGMNMVSFLDDNKKEKNSSEKLGKDCNSVSDNDRPVSPPVQPLHEETSSSETTTPPIKRTKSTTPLRNPSTLLANVSLCKRPAVMEGDEAIPVVPQPLEIADHIQDFPHREIARVHTLSFRHALETMETAAQLSLMSLIMREQLIPRSPAEAVDLALLSFPHCTFVFYFAEFSTQYTVVIRPADRSFFIRRSVQAYGLSDYHTKKVPQPSVKTTTTTTTTSGRTSPPRFVPTQTDKNISKSPLSINPVTRKHNANSVDVSQVIQESNAEWIAINDSLVQSLHDLHADLWAPIQNSMRMSHCSYNEAECFILVVDPTLLHVPFPALQDSTPGSDPLGQQFTMVVTPTLAQFLYSMRREESISILDSPQQDRCIFLPDKPSRNSTTAIIQPSSQGTSRIGLQSRKSSAATVWSSASVAFEDPRHSSSTYYTTTASIDFAGIEPSLAHMSHPWTLFTGCTRKEMISAFASPCCRALMILCDPVEHMFKVADGMVRLADLTRTQPRLPESLDIIVITSDRTTAPSAVEPGVAARLCLHHGCRRVLRVDLPQGNSITFAHEQVLRMFLEKLELTLRSRMRYPYALALRMAQTEARRIGYDPVVWAAFTLIGAA